MLGILVVMFGGFFWLFRVVVTLLYTTETDFPIVPINATIEIILLFVTFLCIVMVAKRKMLGAVAYLIAQGIYFGVDAYMSIATIIEGQAEIANYATLLISIVGVIIPVIAILDIGLSNGKKGSAFRNKKTDWFYGTTDYERQHDDRADQNQYKF